jgi:nucleotide-binding universal stress UspA family protein
MSLQSLRLAAEGYLEEEWHLEQCGEGPAREEHLGRVANAREALRRQVEVAGNTSRQPQLVGRILVAIDGSPEAEKARRLAADLAAETAAEVMLVAVADTRWTHGPDEIAYTEAELRIALRERVDELLREAAARMPAGVAVETSLPEGEPSAQILKTAGDWGADLVIMGAHGKGRLRSLIVGSVTQEVLRRAHCPVLIVSHSAAGAERPRREREAARAPTAVQLGAVLQEETES